MFVIHYVNFFCAGNQVRVKLKRTNKVAGLTKKSPQRKRKKTAKSKNILTSCSSSCNETMVMVKKEKSDSERLDVNKLGNIIRELHLMRKHMLLEKERETGDKIDLTSLQYDSETSSTEKETNT